jgi:hypothetical protein
MTNLVARLFDERRGTRTETAETARRYGLLRRPRLIRGWTLRPYKPEVENPFGRLPMPDSSWSEKQTDDWRERHERGEELARSAESGIFLSDQGVIWEIGHDGQLWPMSLEEALFQAKRIAGVPY